LCQSWLALEMRFSYEQCSEDLSLQSALEKPAGHDDALHTGSHDGQVVVALAVEVVQGEVNSDRD
jgi:hypothetical protein